MVILDYLIMYLINRNIYKQPYDKQNKHCLLSLSFLGSSYISNQKYALVKHMSQLHLLISLIDFI